MLIKPVIAFMFGLFVSSLHSQEKLDKWIDQMESPVTDKRIEAVLKIGELLPTADEIDADKGYAVLFNALGDHTSLVQSASRMHLAKLRGEALPYLKKYIESDQLSEFSMACEAIKSIGPESKEFLPVIAKRLDGDSEKFLMAALHAMRVMDREALMPYLDKTIKALDSKNFNVQLSACRVIVQIGELAKKAGPRLVKLLEEGIASSRSWASIALGAIGPHEDYDVVDLLSQRLDRFYLVDRERALVGLAYLGPEAKAALPAVEKLMKARNKSVQHVAARTRWKITGEADPTVDVLIPLLPTIEYGADAMDILAEMESAAKKAVPYLIEQTKSAEPPSRESAVYALAAIGAEAESAIPELKNLIKKEKDRLIREAAELAIQTIKEALEAQSKKADSTESDNSKATDKK